MEYPVDPKEVIKLTLDHLADQGCTSYDSFNHECLYRGPEGTKCAVGFWISDDEYEPRLEGAGVVDLIKVLPPCPLKDFLTRHQTILSELQEFHDSFLPDKFTSESMRSAYKRYIEYK